MPWITLAKTHSIADGSAREFSLGEGANPTELFVVHSEGRFFAYLNRCPHTGVTLNWQPGQFFDFMQQFIQCSTHGALFRIENGFCVRGPCAGASLQAVPLQIDNDEIQVQLDQVQLD